MKTKTILVPASHSTTYTWAGGICDVMMVPSVALTFHYLVLHELGQQGGEYFHGGSLRSICRVAVCIHCVENDPVVCK